MISSVIVKKKTQRNDEFRKAPDMKVIEKEYPVPGNENKSVFSGFRYK